MIKQYFKQSLVLLQQNKLLSVIAIIGTYFGTGPDFDPENRRFGIGIEAKLYYRDCNA